MRLGSPPFPAAALVLSVCLGLSACGSDPPRPRSEFSGAELFLDARCDSCHGGDRRGSWMGPPLAGLTEHWQAAEIARYLRDPVPVIEATPRLAKMRRKFPSVMRAFPELTKSERLRIARWLLSLESPSSAASSGALGLDQP